jgi:2-hydroxychromene-2-carboxylate isomerase
VYQDDLALADSETLLVAAGDAGLDLARFQETLDDPSCLERLAKDHTRAIGRGVFGTPTFGFPNAEPVYLKLTRVLTPEESLGFWETFRSTAVDRPYVLEFKRPH